MDFVLNKRISNPSIVIGFPGFGLVGSVSTEYIIEFLKAEYVGRLVSDKLPPVAAVHNESVVMPLGIYYVKKFNLLIVHGVSGIQNIEWEIARTIIDIATKTKAKELISLESVGTQDLKSNKVYFYSNDSKNGAKFEKQKLERLREGIIMGVTGTLMIETKNKTKLSAVFAETHTQLPDSMAASRVLEALNGYLNLKMDLTALKQAAERFEKKIKDIIGSQAKVIEEAEQKHLSYMG